MFTQERNYLNVRSVVRASARVHVFRPIRESTLEKNHINVMYAVRTSVTVHVLRTIRKSTLARIFKNDKCANGFSQDIYLQGSGTSMLVRNTIKD